MGDFLFTRIQTWALSSSDTTIPQDLVVLSIPLTEEEKRFQRAHICPKISGQELYLGLVLTFHQ